MENVNFQPSGEEIERALMDLGPLLGVTIKEEVPDELADPSLSARSGINVSSTPDGGMGGPGSVAESGGGGSPGEGADGAEGGACKGSSADSLASPSAARAQPAGTRCVLCNILLTLSEGTPKLMECLHSACEPCLKARIEERQASSRDFLGAERATVTCPACRLQCQLANMIDQRFVLEKMAIDHAGTNGAISGEQQCNSCEDTEPATSYCVDCAEFICDNCVHAHQRLKITKDHTIKCKDEALAELAAAAQGAGRNAHDMWCAEHPQERLSLFCETCDRLTCRDCQLTHHRDHKYQFSTEMAAQARANISSLLSEVSYKRVLLGSAMKVIRDRQQLIADKKKALVHEITQTVVKLTNAINTRGKQLVLRLNEVCDAKQRTLSEKKEALEQLAAITDHCVEFVNGALESGSDTAVLHAKRAVCAHLQRIKSRRADIPNPEIPVRISLSLDKLPELVRVLASIGAIMVDGKLDGGGGAAGAGAGGAQGPYHPPAPIQQQSAPHQQQGGPHSAVVALQHAAMHQSYMAAGAAGASGGAGASYLSPQHQHQMRARHTTPLRHAHVTSTTHPHHLHGVNELNLRGLLNAQTARARALAPAMPPAHPQHPTQIAMHHAYHQMMGFANANAYGTNTGGGGAGGGGGSNMPGCGRRSGGPRTPSPAPPPAYPHAAKWHIPQQALANGAYEAPAAPQHSAPSADFKITLGRAPRAAPPSGAVTSTNPKTPSPSLNGAAVPGELDKVCAASVQDLMATIAKLDSNGVQVVAEEPAPSPAPAVHSSTDAAKPPPGPGDPNEDWCAVCMDGGELMCCDKCPKVFHQYCHIPTIEKLPDETETWQCLLCVNFAELGAPEEEPVGGALGPRAQKIVERVTLELYCQYETSLPFREPVPPDNLHYHAKISRPMCLDTIRMKLQPRSPHRYAHIAQFVSDCRLMFRNAYQYNPVDSPIYKDAKRLEEFFDAQLVKWLPEYAYWSGEGEPPNKRARLD